jgi:ABC-2 type transport system permease protein
MTGTATLLRLALRRDRLMAPAWILMFVAIAWSSAAATTDLYPTAESRTKAADLINNSPALIALYGRVYDDTLGAVSLIKLAGLGTAFVAVFTILLVIRHTRADEELGRTELMAAGSLGRYATLASALIEATLVSLTLGLLTGLALIGTGLPAAGSFAFAGAWAFTGIAFAAIAGVAAQLTTTARSARGIAMTVLATAYVFRSLGDAWDKIWVSWLSPIGWAQQARPYAGDRWWVFALLFVLAAAATAVAGLLLDRRDLGAGLLPDRPGPREAAPSLNSPLALAWRLHRTTLLFWSVGFGLLGAIMGSIASNVAGALDSASAKEMIQKLGGVQSLTDGFVSTELGFLAVFASAFAVSVVARLASEEASTRSETLLASGASRLQLAGSHLLVAIVGVTVLMLVVGLALGTSHAVATSDTTMLTRDLGASVARLPATYVMAGLAALIYGAVAKLASAWALLVAFMVLGVFGPLMNLPKAVHDLSPYAHAPSLPGGDVRVLPLVSLCLLAVVLLAAGMGAFQRRDVTAR